MRWDDLQLLRLIDEFEVSDQAGHLSSGYNLIQAASSGQTIDWTRDTSTFARELLLAVPRATSNGPISFIRTDRRPTRP